MQSAPAQLDYAPRPPWHSRHFARRLALAFLAGVVLSSWYWGPPAWRHGQLLYWQHKCLTYSAPSDQLVYEETRGYFSLIKSSGFTSVGPRAAGRESRELLRFRDLCGQSSRDQAAAVFVHELRSRQGYRRLVAVEASQNCWPFTSRCTVVAPASLLHGPRVVSDYTDLVSPFVPSSRALWRLYAGQPDPRDHSHFTIVCENAGQPGIIDGWLSDDGQSVKLEVRALPRPATNEAEP